MKYKGSINLNIDNINPGEQPTLFIEEVLPIIEPPYFENIRTITELLYNPNFGNNRICECGHTYERHFDPSEQWQAVGCKYCGCDFKEKK